MMMLPILESFVASSQKFSSVTSSRLFFLNKKWIILCISKLFKHGQWYLVNERDTHCKNGRTDLQANLNQVLSDLVLISNKLTVRLTNSFKYLPDFLMVTILKVMQIFPEKTKTKRNATQFYLYRVSKLCDINWLWVVAIKDAERPAASHVEVLVFEKQGDKCPVCHLKNAILHLAWNFKSFKNYFNNKGTNLQCHQYQR